VFRKVCAQYRRAPVHLCSTAVRQNSAPKLRTARQVAHASVVRGLDLAAVLAACFMITTTAAFTYFVLEPQQTQLENARDVLCGGNVPRQRPEPSSSPSDDTKERGALVSGTVLCCSLISCTPPTLSAHHCGPPRVAVAVALAHARHLGPSTWPDLLGLWQQRCMECSTATRNARHHSAFRAFRAIHLQIGPRPRTSVASRGRSRATTSGF
jgi:hypothetical protein